ncbi:hypothetical protein [Agromyces sp. Root81]|uniref:hypothetical protein n=1 Tax=Agromyces sp. Root81 TaxID=1736601 RepID=UPI0012FA6067|nr:hypothetical protein [Agromyces sp. Root81]
MSVVTVAGVDVDGTTVSVSGFVSGVVESDGVCTFILTSTVDGATVTRENDGAADAANTTCGTVQLPITEFTRGTWTVELDYSSGQATTTSETVELEIP